MEKSNIPFYKIFIKQAIFKYVTNDRLKKKPVARRVFCIQLTTYKIVASAHCR